jgi:hypothetical protein
MSNNISDLMAGSYLLADLTVRVWSARRTDKEESRKLCESNNADPHAARVIKELFVGNDSLLKETMSAYNSIRNMFHTSTLPWSPHDDGRKVGQRLVSIKGSLDLLSEFATLKTKAAESRNRFVAEYDRLVKQSAQSAGGLYNADLYPSKDQIASMFDAHLVLTPVPVATDFNRVALPGAFCEGLKQLLEKQAEASFGNAVSELQKRMLDRIKRLGNSLGKLANGESVRLHASVMESLIKQVGEIRELNVAKDPAIEEMAMAIENDLCKYDMRAFKHNPALAGEVAKKAMHLADAIPNWEVTPQEEDEPVVIEEPEVTPKVQQAIPVAPIATNKIDFDDEEVFY